MAFNPQPGYGGYPQAKAVPVQGTPLIGQLVQAQPMQATPITGHAVQSSPYVVPASDVRVLPAAGAAAQSNRVQMGQVPTSFPQLAELSEDELAYMHDNSVAFDDWLSDLPVVRDLTNKADETFEKNRQEAQSLLDRRGELDELRRSRDEIRQAVEQKRQAVNGLQAQRSEIANRHAPEKVLEQLSQVSQEANAAAEQELEEFKSGSGADFEAFKRRYLERKTEFHRKTAIRERIFHSNPQCRLQVGRKTETR